MTRHARWQVPLLGVMAGTAMSDANINSTALVDASRGLGMSPDLLPVAASAMSMCLAASVISTGLLADRAGRRRVLMIALAFAIGAELLTAASPEEHVFILGRCLVGVALGIIFAASFAMVRAVAQPGRIGSALGMFGASMGLTMIVESFVGGSLASVGWRIAYLVVPVVFAVALVLVPRLLPVQPRIGSGPVDPLGQVLLAVGIAGPLFALSRVTVSMTSPATWVPAVVGVVSFGAFVIVESRSPHPFFPVRVLRDPRFIAATLAGLSLCLSNAVLVLQVSNVWQYLMGLETVQVAAGQVPGLSMGVVASVVAGRMLSAGRSERSIAAAGFALVVFGFATLTVYRYGSSFWVFVPAMFAVGAGSTTLGVPFGKLIMDSAPADAYGPVTASRTTIGQIGYSVGLAGATVIADRLTQGGITRRLEEAQAPAVDLGRSLDAVTFYMRTGDAPTTVRPLLRVAAESYGVAFATTMGITALALLCMGVATWLILGRRGVHAPPSTQ